MCETKVLDDTMCYVENLFLTYRTTFLKGGHEHEA